MFAIAVIFVIVIVICSLVSNKLPPDKGNSHSTHDYLPGTTHQYDDDHHEGCYYGDGQWRKPLP